MVDFQSGGNEVGGWLVGYGSKVALIQDIDRDIMLRLLTER